MGMFVDGEWKTDDFVSKENQGAFKRKASSFRNWITPDGAAGPSGASGFKAEVDRYHLYVSHACPWAHRTMIFRKLKNLETIIPVSVVDPFMGERGWKFSNADGAIPDPLHNAELMGDIYLKADPSYTGRVTVPVLWDKHQNTIVSNESSEIIRMFNSAFDGLTGNNDDYYPEALREEIDTINERIYHTVNNGVYKCGFAGTQQAYEEAFGPLFETLDFLEQVLSENRYLTGDRLTEADWRLFTTLVRFDPVYVGHFKCNLRRIADYPNLSDYLRELYQMPGIAETVNLTHIKNHYYESHTSVNPSGIVPLGPELELDAAHGREKLPAA